MATKSKQTEPSDDGVPVRTWESQARRYEDGVPVRIPDVPEQTAGPVGYEATTVVDLKAEIERRNIDRDEADRISLQGNKPDLIAALEADDTKEK